MTPLHPTEAEFAEVVIGLARLRGWRCAHFRPARTEHGWRTAMTGDVGFPDLVLARRGIVLFVELKSARGGLTVEQRAWRDSIAPSGMWHLWRPSDVAEIKRVLL